jgi:hypothetical protein
VPFRPASGIHQLRLVVVDRPATTPLSITSRPADDECTFHRRVPEHLPCTRSRRSRARRSTVGEGISWSKKGACFLPELAHQAVSMKKLARTLKKGLFFS